MPRRVESRRLHLQSWLEQWPRAVLVMAVIALTSCGGRDTRLTYNPTTGKLAVVAADLNHDGKINSWTYMDGTKILRTESDLDGDGKIDRWEYDSPDGKGKVIKVALSTRKSGSPDTWVYPDPEGGATDGVTQPARIESSSTGDEKRIDHWEYYEHGKLVRIEEDTDGDGRPDKWEQHDGAAVLLSVEFDHKKNGVPDERWTYAPNGRVVSIETEPNGRGGYLKKKVMDEK